MRRALITLLWSGFCWLLAGMASASAAQPVHADIRVLIDISGSMKQNDPQNLRRPALRMLVGLLQPGSKAGVWTFAQYANALVPPAEVDKAWKQQALAASQQIDSPGMFTNIERVLRRAIHDWEGVPPHHRRNLLLLTDGMVDVSKTPGESAASRQRILDELLPRIRELQAQVHTIALSSRADHELLKRLAHDSGGWYQQVDSADQLQRVFLKLFEQAGQPDGLPLKGNKFRVDNTIREATVLVFRADGNPEPRLTTPSGSTFGRDDAPGNVTWYHDTGYELVTLHDPQVGEWTLAGDVDPDNRVMVVTDLRLQLSELPGRIAAGEPLPVSASLTNDGRLITRHEFLDLVEVRAETLGERGLAPQPLNDKGYKGDTRAGDGRYGMDLVENRAQPELNLVVAAESPTFLRERRHLLAVVEPATLVVGKDDQGVPIVTLRVDDTVMGDRKPTVTAWQPAADDSRQPLILSPQSDGSQVAVLSDPAAPVYARIEGITRLGNHIDHEIGPVYAPGMAPPTPPPAAAPPAHPAAEPTAAQPSAPPAPRAEAETEPEQQDAQSGWLMPAIAFVAVNLLLGGGGLFWWRRRRRRDDEEIALLDEGEEAVTPSGKEPEA